jgi:hypothetical protein
MYMTASYLFYNTFQLLKLYKVKFAYNEFAYNELERM